MRTPSGGRVLIVGVSTRALVESAVRAGYVVTSVDAYADLDQPTSATCYSLPDDFGVPWSPGRAARAARDIDADSVVYGSNWENHARALAVLTTGRELWGNSPAALRRVRNPLNVRDAFRARGIPAPDVVLSPRRRSMPDGDSRGIEWLMKPRRSGGGHGVRPWTGAAWRQTHYLQQRVEGRAGSVVFVAAGGRAVVLGVTTQLVGDMACGAAGFRYCGSLLWSSAMRSSAIERQANALAGVVADTFELIGVGSVDFILRGGVMHPIEVNPRWTASLELVERACGLSMFAVHAAACVEAALPNRVALSRSVHGKAVVFGRHTATAGDTKAWLADDSVRDVPRPGTRLVRGAPVCTVFADEPTSDVCEEQLRRRAAAVHDTLSRWREKAA